MTTLAHTCPFCRCERIALRIVRHEIVDAFNGYIWWRCPDPACKGAGAAIVRTGHSGNWQKLNNETEISSLFIIMEFWPEPEPPVIPDYLPDKVLKAFAQAEDNFPKIGNEEASGMMYGRALEITLKNIESEAKGSFKNRIETAAKNGKLTRDLADWAHNVRILRNDSTHEMDGIKREDLEQLRGLTEMILRYVYTLPGMITEKKKETSPESSIEEGANSP